MLVNPAMAGAVEGDARFNVAHRWRKASHTENYQTSIASADIRVKNRLMRGGLGFLVSTDKVPGIRTNNLQAAFAYEAPFGARVRYDHLRVGFQAGLVHRGLNMDDLVFEDQFNNQSLDFGGRSSEDVRRMSQISPDVSMGLMWYRTQKIRGNPEFNPFVGVAMQHINRPQLGFTGDDRERANMRYTLQAGGRFTTRTAFEFNVNAVYAIQNFSNQLTINFFTRVLLFENGVLFGRHAASVMVGTVFRPGDVAVAYLGFELKKSISFGMAYDFYTGKDNFTRTAYGGMHVMFSYLLNNKRFREPSLPFPFF